MPKTAVVNRRRKSTRRKRRRNPQAAGAATSTVNRRRRRRRRPRRRRRNPTEQIVRRAYSSAGYRRKPNPNGGFFTFQDMIEIVPSATAGDFAARFAVKQAGPFEDDEPTFKHALAIWVAASLGGQLVGNLLNDRIKGLYAAISAFGFGGSLFARKVFFKEAEWLEKNLYLGDGSLGGFQDRSILGQVYTDQAGQQWKLVQEGGQYYWQLAGMGQAAPQEQYRMAPDPSRDPNTQLTGFQDRSVLGYGRFSAQNSFGYSN